MDALEALVTLDPFGRNWPRYVESLDKHKERRFYVYELQDPDTKTPFYVGKGTNSRARMHETEAGTSCNCDKCYRIRQIWHRKRRVRIVVLISNLLEIEALEIEYGMLRYYEDMQRPIWRQLTNKHPGNSVVVHKLDTARRTVDKNIRAEFDKEREGKVYSDYFSVLDREYISSLVFDVNQALQETGLDNSVKLIMGPDTQLYLTGRGYHGKRTPLKEALETLNRANVCTFDADLMNDTEREYWWQNLDPTSKEEAFQFLQNNELASVCYLAW